MERKSHQSDFKIISLNRPFLLSRTSTEVWMMNPPRRYVVNADQIPLLSDYIDTVSDLRTSTHYRPLDGKVNLVKSKILVERCRDRGIGDLLFLTGVFAYLQHMHSQDVAIYTYALSDRGQCLAGNPAIFQGTPLYGPLAYSDLPDFDAHWFIESVTEHDEEKDQLNVYDALYRSIQVDPDQVHPQFKRPYVYLTNDDLVNLDAMYYHIAQDRKFDLRHIPYYVVAPLANGSLRNTNYRLWLDTIDELAKYRPVVVLGRINDGRMPSSDMSFGAFFQELANNKNPNVINLMGDTPLRLVMALVGRALCAITLDSGLLYVAQGLRVPAISLWGTHDPLSRIGYDPDYMELAIWPKSACRVAPCFAYEGLPYHKCPEKTNQRVCEVLKAITMGHIIEKVKVVEQRMADSLKPTVKTK